MKGLECCGSEWQQRMEGEVLRPLLTCFAPKKKASGVWNAKPRLRANSKSTAE